MNPPSVTPTRSPAASASASASPAPSPRADDYRTLHGALQLTTVMITHDLLEAILLADRIAVMQDGRIVDEGTPHELLTASKHDYVRDLMAKPRRQADRVAALAAEAAK